MLLQQFVADVSRQRRFRRRAFEEEIRARLAEGQLADAQVRRATVVGFHAAAHARTCAGRRRVRRQEAMLLREFAPKAEATVATQIQFQPRGDQFSRRFDKPGFHDGRAVLERQRHHFAVAVVAKILRQTQRDALCAGINFHHILPEEPRAEDAVAGTAGRIIRRKSRHAPRLPAQPTEIELRSLEHSRLLLAGDAHDGDASGAAQAQRVRLTRRQQRHAVAGIEHERLRIGVVQLRLDHHMPAADLERQTGRDAIRLRRCGSGCSTQREHCQRRGETGPEIHHGVNLVGNSAKESPAFNALAAGRRLAF